MTLYKITVASQVFTFQDNQLCNLMDFFIVTLFVIINNFTQVGEYFGRQFLLLKKKKTFMIHDCVQIYKFCEPLS